MVSGNFASNINRWPQTLFRENTGCLGTEGRWNLFCCFTTAASLSSVNEQLKQHAGGGRFLTSLFSFKSRLVSHRQMLAGLAATSEAWTHPADTTLAARGYRLPVGEENTNFIQLLSPFTLELIFHTIEEKHIFWLRLCQYIWCSWKVTQTCILLLKITIHSIKKPGKQIHAPYMFCQLEILT